MTPIERFRKRATLRPNGCWTMPKQGPSGYSRFWLGYGHTQLAHRAAYLLFVGPIPEGLDLDHLCRNRACCNPAHLEPVTRSENLRRGLSGVDNAVRQWAKTHCPRGHAFDDANTQITKKGHRQCRACRRAQSAASKQRRREMEAA